MQHEIRQCLVRQRIGAVADLREGALGELVGVGDDGGAAREILQVGLERGGVHRDQHVGLIAGGEDVVIGDLDLERRDTGQRALRRPDLGGKVRLGGQVVAERGGLVGEAIAGQLHPVPGVPGEPNDDLFQFRCADITLVRNHVPASLPRR